MESEWRNGDKLTTCARLEFVLKQSFYNDVSVNVKCQTLQHSGPAFLCLVLIDSCNAAGIQYTAKLYLFSRQEIGCFAPLGTCSRQGSEGNRLSCSVASGQQFESAIKYCKCTWWVISSGAPRHFVYWQCNSTKRWQIAVIEENDFR